MLHRGLLSRCDSPGMRTFLSPVWLLTFLLFISPGVLARKQKLLIFMLDGFRWDYFDRDGLTGLKMFLNNGTRAQYLVNSFPTISFPNYYTIMTGLYSEDHGFIDNTMYDPVHNTEFLMSGHAEYNARYWWDDGEPVWITARKHGKKSYMYFWPGCGVTIRNHKPNYCREYKGPPSMNEFRDAIWDGLNAFLDDSADLVAIYFELTDKMGHMFGPDSFQLQDVLKKLGDAIETMLIQMKIMHLMDNVNILLVSDHGMTKISPKRVINLNRCLDMKDINHIYGATFLSVWPHKDKIKKVYENLHNCHKNLTIYYKHEIPDRWHLKDHYRVPPIVAVADLGYYIIKPPSKHFPKVSGGGTLGGYHGYDNLLPDMRGIFAASGPEFRKNEVVPGVNAVDIYNLMCKILDIDPAPNRGDWSNIAPMLARAEPLPPPSPQPTEPPPPPPTTTTTRATTTTTTLATTTRSTTTTTTQPSTMLPEVQPRTSRSPPSKPSQSPMSSSVSPLSSTPVPPALPPVSTPSTAPSTESSPTSTREDTLPDTYDTPMSATSVCRPILMGYMLAIILICVGILG